MARKLRVLVDIGHPAHVHMFKNVIRILQQRGHHVLVLLMDKDNAGLLLRQNDIDHIRVGSSSPCLVKKLLTYAVYWSKVLRIAHRWKPDFFIGESSPSTYVSRLMGKTSIMLFQNEHAFLDMKTFMPTTDVVLASTSFSDRLPAGRTVRFPGNAAMMYLHPDYFTPVSGEELGIQGRYIVVRLVAWSATHDQGERGISRSELASFLRKLERFGRVVLSSEEALPEELEIYRMPVPPEDIHHVLANSIYHIGEGATMVMEAADLGVRSVYISTIRRGYLDDLEKEHGLVKCFNTLAEAEETIMEELDAVSGRNMPCSGFTDLNRLMVDLMEDHPGLFRRMRSRKWWEQPDLRSRYIFR